MGKRKGKKRASRKQAPRRHKASKPLAAKNAWYQRKNLVLLLLGILALTIIAYSPTFNNEFTNWDDDMYVEDNPLVKSLSGENIKRMFLPSEETFVGGNYHPLTVFTLAINYRLTGMDISSYHWLNILLHLLNTFLVFLLIHKLTRGKSDIALIAALIFGIHPMHVESVSWIAERKDVLYTAFFLPGLIFYLNYLKDKSGSNYALTALFFVLSCLAKPAAVVFPVVLVLLDYFRQRSFSSRAVLEKLPLFAFSIVLGLYTVTAQRATDAYGGLAEFNIIDRFMFAGYGFTMYIVRFFYPYEMSAFYPYPESTDLPAEYYIATLVALLIGGAAIWSMRKTRIVALGIGFYLATIALVLQFVTVGSAILADRYTYVPYIGLALLVGYGYHHLQKGTWPSLQKYARPALGIIALGSIALAAVAYERTKVWKDSETLFTNVIENYPKAGVAYQNRGHYYRTQSSNADDPNKRNQLLQQAMEDYNNGIEIRPDNATLYSNRGKVWFEWKEYEKALEDYNKSLELRPNDAQTLINRGAVRGMLGDTQGALADFNKAVELDPQNPNGYFNRGILLGQLDRSKEALADYNKYLEFYPNRPGMYNSKGVEYQKMGDHQQAIQEFNTAINLNPKEAVFHLNKSYSYYRMGQIKQAQDAARQALNLGGNIDQSYLQKIGLR